MLSPASGASVRLVATAVGILLYSGLLFFSASGQAVDAAANAISFLLTADQMLANGERELRRHRRLLNDAAPFWRNQEGLGGSDRRR